VEDLSEVLTPRLILRRMKAEDWELLRLLDGDVEVMATLGGPRSPAATRRYAAEQARYWTEHSFGWWTVFDRDSKEFVGRGGLRHIELEDGKGGIEVGYALIPSRWGQGLATEIAETAVEVGIETLRLERIIGITLPWNRASRRVLEKVGLKYAGETKYKGFPQVLYEWVREPW
jgi:RimJ/RimL family protein N-acetyltransferase